MGTQKSQVGLWRLVRRPAHICAPLSGSRTLLSGMGPLRDQGTNWEQGATWQKKKFKAKQPIASTSHSTPDAVAVVAAAAVVTTGAGDETVDIPSGLGFCSEANFNLFLVTGPSKVYYTSLGAGGCAVAEQSGGGGQSTKGGWVA